MTKQQIIDLIENERLNTLARVEEMFEESFGRLQLVPRPDYYDFDDTKLRKQYSGKDEKLKNQRIALRNFEEKLALMKTWRGIFRSIGQRLGLCR